MIRTITLLPGDGIGPEVTAAAVDVLDAVNNRFNLNLTWDEYAFGGAALDETSNPFPEKTREACLGADAVFLGAVGGPKWEQSAVRPEAGLLALRRAMDVFANLRPTRILPDLIEHSPLRTVSADTDFLIVRELTGGIYFGERQEGEDFASDVCAYSRDEVARIARVAFTAARRRKGRVVSVDKANVLASSRLWRTVVADVQRDEFPDIELSNMLVDAMAMKLVQVPDQFDVILTENMFGDILSDEASVIAGSIGLAPSASLGAGTAGLYEPIHGSAPDIAGQDKANPVGAIASVAMMLRHSFAAEAPAAAIEAAINTVISAGHRTQDLGGSTGCRAMAALIASAL